MPAPHSKLTPEEREHIAQLCRDGMPVKDIARLTDRCTESIRAIRKAAGVESARECRPFTDVEKDVVRSLYGIKSCSEIGKTLNRSANDVWLVVRALRLERPRNQDLNVSLSPKVFTALSDAARRRSVPADQLVHDILDGVLFRGSVDRTLAGREFAHVGNRD